LGQKGAIPTAWSYAERAVAVNVDTYTAISLFSGIGGLDLGVRGAIPTRTIAYVEREASCARVLAQRASEGLLDEAPIYSDVKSFPAEIFAGKVDILIGGFPCQPFSVAGKQEGSEDERNLWPDTIRLIRSLRPRYAFVENVPGLVSHEYFGTILGDLAQAGFDAEWGAGG
jgi:DNA (cytosine-5)-methyltransferase 1